MSTSLALCWPAPAGADECTTAVASECLRITAPLDPSGAVPGSVELYVERVGDGPPRKAAVVPLVGGPGQATTPLTRDLTRVLGPALRERDLLAIDLRGTGRSTPLDCAALKGDGGDFDRSASRCAAELGVRVQLFGTDAVVADIEEVRRAFDIERLTLVGVSYGTHVALAYAAAHPERVERLVLDSPVPLGGVDPFNLSTLRAAPRVLDAACARACAQITRNPGGDLARLVARLRGRSLTGFAYRARGRRVRRRIDGAHLLELLVLGDLTAQIRPRIPSAVASGLRGDYAPLLRLVGILEHPEVRRVESPPGLSRASFLATVCEDSSFPWSRETPVPQRSNASRAALSSMPITAFRPFDRATALASRLSFCEQWPTADAGSPFDTSRLPDVPALVLTSGHDIRTPYENAAEIASKFPRGELVEVPQATHAALPTSLDVCARRALEAFLADALPPPPCARRDKPLVHISPVIPRRLEEVPAARGLPQRAGQLLNAVALTIADAQREAGLFGTPVGRGRLAVGGLRGGSYETFLMRFKLRGKDRANPAVRMRNLEYVPGVRVTGVARGGAYWNLRISVNGEVARLRTRKRFIVEGQLAGKHFKVRTPDVFFD